VGGFQSPSDPQAQTIIQNFGAKMKFDASAGREVLVAEMLQLPQSASAENFAWIMDPQPQVVAVPRLR
jgi:hypothetical protein